MRSRDPLPWLGAVGLLAMIGCLVLTRKSPGLAPDSAVYLGTAHNLANGHGLTTPFNLMFNPYPPARVAAFGGDVPLTQYPPLFPVVLSVFGWLGMGLVGAARALNAVLFGCNVALIGVLVVRITRSNVIGVLSALAFAMTANVLLNHGFVMSEPLMLTSLLAGILLLPRLLRAPGLGTLGAVGACAAAASLTRLAGVSFTIAAVAAVLIWLPRPWATRGRYAAGLFAMGVGPLAVWGVGTRLVSPSADVRPIRFHPPGWRQFDTAVDTASGWLVGVGPERPLRVVLLATLVAVSVVLGVVVARPRAPRPHRGVEAANGDALRLLAILALFIVAYLVMVVGTNVFLDASTSLEGRLLLPVQITGGVLVVGLVYRVALGRFGTVVAAAAAIAVLVWCAWPGRAITIPFGSTSTISALDDSFPARRRSPVAVAADRLPAGTLFATNVPAVLYLDSGRPSIFVPPRQYLVAGERNDDFGAQVRELGRVLAARHGYLVLYPDFNRALASLADLEKGMKLVEVGRYRDGSLYRVDAAAPA